MKSSISPELPSGAICHGNATHLGACARVRARARCPRARPHKCDLWVLCVCRVRDKRQKTKKDLAAYSISIHKKSLCLIFARGPEHFFSLSLWSKSFLPWWRGALLKCKVEMAQQGCRQTSKEAQIWSQGFPEHPPECKALERLDSCLNRSTGKSCGLQTELAITIPTMFWFRHLFNFVVFFMLASWTKED